MKKYEILKLSDYAAFNIKMKEYMNKNIKAGVPFKKMNITVKSWRKDKTPKQHRYYWAVIAEVEKAFREVGYEYSRNEVHEFIKKTYGFTRLITHRNGEVTEITKSISDNSEDVNTKAMAHLIDFAIRWTSINLGYVIEDPRGQNE